MANILSMICKKEREITGKSTEYLDKYLFPFEKPDGSKEGYFELVLSFAKCLQDDNYLSSIVFPVDMKYLEVRLHNDLSIYNYYSRFTVEDEVNINKKITDTIPLHIEYLKCKNYLPVRFNQFKQLKTLIIDNNYSDNDNDNDSFEKSFYALPESLVRLELFIEGYDCKLDNLPPNLKYLLIDVICGEQYANGYSHPLDNLPHSLEVLYFPDTCFYRGIQYSGNLHNLPSGLKYLYLPENISVKTDYNNLPDSLEIIEFDNYPRIVENIDHYPSSLKKIYSNMWYNNDETAKQYEKVNKKIKSLNLERKFDIYYRIKPLQHKKFDYFKY